MSVETEAGCAAVALPVFEDLGLVPHHQSIPELERFVFPGVPHLVSVHTITQADTDERMYCALHRHEDEDEINIFLGTTDDFRFRVTVNGTEQVVGPVAALTIPAGVLHSANVLSGSGHYVVFKVRASDTDS